MERMNEREEKRLDHEGSEAMPKNHGNIQRKCGHELRVISGERLSKRDVTGRKEKVGAHV